MNWGIFFVSGGDTIIGGGSVTGCFSGGGVGSFGGALMIERTVIQPPSSVYLISIYAH